MKNLLKIFPILCLTLLIISCDKDDDTSECVCIEIYEPVCGDDGNEYANSCYAECAGVNFIEGTCPITTAATVRDLGDPALDGCGWVIEFDVDGTLQNHRPDELAEEYEVADLEIQLTYKPTLDSSVCGLVDMIPVIEIVQVSE